MIDRELTTLEKELAQILSSSLRAAEIVWKVKTERFPNSCTDWLTWANKQTIGRRYAFRLLKVGEFMRDLEERFPVYHGTLTKLTQDVAKLETLADIDPSQLGLFLSKHDLIELDRDELRDAVARFLGKDRKAAAPAYQQSTFWDYAKLPDPEQLILSASSQKVLDRLDYSRETLLSKAFLARACAVAGKITDGNLRALAHELTGVVEQAIRERKGK